MKKLILKLSVVLCAFLVIFAVCGCVDKGVLPKDYVEVDSIRIKDATIFLSPTGDTASYQLAVEILPANATNRKLNYYIPSEFLEYVSIDTNGLLHAKAEPPKNKETKESIRIPLYVNSTSNKKATMELGVIIENAEVLEINFRQTQVEMLYNSDSVKLEYDVVPRHAQDGRNITFRSLDTNVASVSADGVLTPKSAGHTTILAEGKTMAGKVVTGRMSAIVKYVAARYALEVSNQSPRYKQTINDKSPLVFNLLSLEPSADPNPRIQWYVGGEKVLGQDGKLQYEHTPNSINPQKYKVSVKVKCKEQTELNYESKPICIYNDFTGFEFEIKNQNTFPSLNYLFNEQVNFEITSSTDGVHHFDWYLSRVGESGKGIKVASTLGASPNLSRKLNLDGDYILNAVGYDNKNNELYGQKQEYKFNVNRYIVGDTLIINPKLLKEGIPPESFNWYLLNCNQQGEVIEGKKLLGSTIFGETFYYKNNTSGKIIIEAQGILNGVLATVDGKGFSLQSRRMEICPKNFENASSAECILNDTNCIDSVNKKYGARSGEQIDDVVIDGINQIGKFAPIVYWNMVSGINSYWIEITKQNGEVLLLNSTEDNDVHFKKGQSYCILPTEFVTLDDKFTVRIKQKGGEFTEFYHYGEVLSQGGVNKYYFDKIEQKNRAFLSEFCNTTINGYIRNLKELGDLLDYILMYQPGVGDNGLISVKENVALQVGQEVRNYKRKYTFKIFMDTTFKDYETFYPIDADTGNLEEKFVDLFKAIVAVQSAYCETSKFMIKLEYDIEDGGYVINIYKNLDLIVFHNTSDVTIDPLKAVSDNYSKNPYGETNENFAINYKAAQSVFTTDQLYNAVENGKMPNIKTDIAQKVFLKAKAVVNAIIGKDMTDEQKVLAFYDWLILNVVYDNDVIDMQLSPDYKGDAFDYEAFHLEGVFMSNKAVCDGIAKAMSLLCGIEGIPCFKVNGIYGGFGHAWNKVFIDGKWYIVDATFGSQLNGVNEYINYSYFMMSDLQFKTLYSGIVTYGERERSDTDYNFYKGHFVNGKDLYLDSKEEMIALLNSFGDNIDATKTLNLMVSPQYKAKYNNDIPALFNDVTSAITGNKVLDKTIIKLGGNDVYVIKLNVRI